MTFLPLQELAIDGRLSHCKNPIAIVAFKKGGNELEARLWCCPILLLTQVHYTTLPSFFFRSWLSFVPFSFCLLLQLRFQNAIFAPPTFIPSLVAPCYLLEEQQQQY